MLMWVYKQNYEYSFLFCPTLFWQPFYLGSEGETCISFHPSQLLRAWRIELVNRIQIDTTLSSWIYQLHKSNSILTNLTHTKQSFYHPYCELTHLSVYMNSDHLIFQGYNLYDWRAFISNHKELIWLEHSLHAREQTSIQKNLISVGIGNQQNTPT